jgi:hypothetical protein
MERIELKASKGISVALIVIAVMLGFIVLAIPAMAPIVIFGGFALLMVFFAIKLGQRRLVIDDNGVTAKGAFSTSTIPWNELDHYTFWSMDQQAVYAAGGAQAGLIGVAIIAIIGVAMAASRNKGAKNRRFSQGRLTIVGQSGRSIAIDGRYAKVAGALDAAFDHLHGRLRGKRDYTPFTLSNIELHHATKGSLGLAEIEKISVAGASLVIKKRDKRLAWARVPMKKIKNGMLFIEELGEHGLVVDAKAGMFVPPTVLDKLHAAASRQAALPAARVVNRD